MTESIYDIGIPENICLMVTFYEKGLKIGFPFKVLYKNGAEFRPFLEKLKETWPEILFSLSAKQEYFYFGSPNSETNDKLAELFDVGGYPRRTAHVQPSEYSPHAEKDRKFYNYLPWDELKEIGDHFFVDNVTTTNITNQAHHQSKATGKKFRTTSVNGGVLVVLVNYPNVVYQKVVRLTEN